jgi:hypothetical protein
MQKFSIKYLQTKFNSILKRSNAMIKLVSFRLVAQVCKPSYSEGRDQEKLG